MPEPADFLPSQEIEVGEEHFVIADREAPVKDFQAYGKIGARLR